MSTRKQPRLTLLPVASVALAYPAGGWQLLPPPPPLWLEDYERQHELDVDGERLRAVVEEPPKDCLNILRQQQRWAVAPAIVAHPDQ